jgi:ArsR family transcriptional regulator
LYHPWASGSLAALVTNEGRRHMNGEDLLRLLRALADPTRFSIFELLLQGRHCNCEICAHLNLPANLVSHHLRVLRQAGLVDTARHPNDARWVYYSINKEALAEAREALSDFLDPSRIAERPALACN